MAHIMPSRSIISDGRISFFIMAEYLIVCVCVCVHVRVYVTHHISFVHFSMDGHLDCFHVLAVVTNAAVDTEVQI